MKTKMSTIILVSAVVLVWGMVAFRIMKWVVPKQEDVSVPTAKMASSDPIADTLILHYRDPFLTRQQEVYNVARQPREVIQVTKSSFPTVIYKGMLRMNDGLPRAILQFQGEIYTLSEGESLSGLKICNVFPERVVVKWGVRKEILDIQ